MIICKECNSLHFEHGIITINKTETSHIVVANTMRQNENDRVHSVLYIGEKDYQEEKCICPLDKNHTVLNYAIEDIYVGTQEESAHIQSVIIQLLGLVNKTHNNDPHDPSRVYLGYIEKIHSIDLSLTPLELTVKVHELFNQLKMFFHPQV